MHEITFAAFADELSKLGGLGTAAAKLMAPGAAAMRKGVQKTLGTASRGPLSAVPTGGAGTSDLVRGIRAQLGR